MGRRATEGFASDESGVNFLIMNLRLWIKGVKKNDFMKKSTP